MASVVFLLLLLGFLLFISGPMLAFIVVESWKAWGEILEPVCAFWKNVAKRFKRESE